MTRRRTRALIRRPSSIFGDLRVYWATGRRVSLTIDSPDYPRAEGFVTRVSATDSSVHVNDVLVPGDRILAVHQPSRLGDSTHREGNPWRGPARRIEQLPGQCDFDL